jgi:hypothetical protein
MHGAALTRFLPLLSAAGSVLAVYKLFSCGLYRKYRVFLLYLVYRVIAAAPPLFLDHNSSGYFYYFLTTAVISWAFYAMVVIELLGLILQRHKGFYTLGRWVICAGIVGSLVISGVGLLPKLVVRADQATPAVLIYWACERGICAALAVFLILTVTMLNFYAVPLSRNVLVHTLVYTVFFLSNTLGMILWQVFGLDYAGQLDTGFAAVSAACGFAWYFLLSAKGEEARFHLPWYRPETEERILSQLDSLNAVLLRATRH